MGKGMRTFDRVWIVGFILSAALYGPVAAFSQDEMPEDERPGTAGQVLEDFDFIWETISKQFVDSQLSGVDWNAAKEQYRPRVAEADDPQTAYQLIAEMLGLLQNQNTFLVPPWRINPPDEQAADPQLEYSGVGMVVQKAESGALVLHVFPGGPAEDEGLLVGDVIIGVDGRPVQDDDSIEQITNLIRGPVGTAVELTIEDPEGVERTLSITRATIDLRPEVEHRRMEGSIGYLRLPDLLSEATSQGARALPQLLATNRLILDLRSVTSGNVEGLVRVAQWFLGAVPLGGFVSREGNQPVTFRMDAIAAYRKPLVVLTNARTYGTAEVLIQLMRDYDRAEIVGNRTAGNFEVGLTVELPSGGVLHLPVARYISPRGRGLPADGIVPDVEVEPPDLATLRDGRDVYLEAAVEILKDSRR